MSDTKLMSIPHKTLKMDDERVGLSPAQIVIWKATHPDPTYADIPTSQEVADHEAHEENEDHEDDSTAENIVPLTEEQRLKRLLASFAKLIWEYFCAK